MITFNKFLLPVPEDLQEFCNDEKSGDVHKEFKKAIDACTVRYLDDKGELLVISRNHTSEKRAQMLQDMHYRNISQRLVLLRR